MGGKQKQAQRTKNNTRPSNSGRSAERLGTTLPPFVSFTGMKETGFSTAGFSLTPIDDIDSSIDSNYQLVFKKMNKKDATTKLKALQEFTELVKNSDAETVKTVLKFWPRIYCMLSTDADHKVREASHIAHNHVVLKAKRNIAPYLKQLVGAWFTSQYDTYPPASSAATQAFKDAFPSNKVQEAIIFCQEEILSYIHDNLFVQTAPPKNQSADDFQAKQERVLISSLQGYTLYLDKVPTEAIQKVEDLNKKIISDGKFWKLSKHNLPHIRSAWFAVITKLCQKAPFLLETETLQVAKAVFGNLDESDPVVQTNIWEAALLTISTIREWWQYISVDDLLLPKLWKVLREGGHGNASVIYPNLLLLLSHLPSTVKPDDFYPKFFDNMRLGLQQKTTKASQSESRAISTSLIECLQYAILKHQENMDLCKRLIQLQLIPVIESCLDSAQSAYKTMFNQIAALVQYWHKNRLNKDLINYKYYSQMFWKNVEILLEDKLIFYADTQKSAVSEMISKQMELLVCLKHLVKPKPQHKLQFTDESVEKTVEVKKEVSTHDQYYLASLKCLVHSTCILYIRIVNLKKIPDLQENVYALVLEFESADIFWDINKIIGGGDQSSSLMDVYTYLLLEWIKSKSLCTRPVVNLLFLLMKYLKNEEKTEIFDQISNIDNIDCLGWCIANGLSYPHNSDQVVQKWLSTEKVGNFLVKIINDEVKDECPPNLSLLLKQAFTENNNGDLFISKKCVSDVITVLTTCLQSPNEFSLTIDTCASLSSYIASIIYTDTLTLSYSDKLLLALFSLSCDNKIDPESLSKDTLWEVNTAWQDAIAIMSHSIEKSDLKQLTEKFASVVEKLVLENDFVDINQNDLTEKIISYNTSVMSGNSLYVSKVMNVFFKRNFVVCWKNALSNITRQAEYLKGYLAYPFERLIFIDCNIKEENIVKYFTWKNIVSNVIANSISEDGGDYDDEEKEEEDGNLYVKLLNQPEEFILDLLEDLVVIQSLLRNYKTIKYYRKVEELQMSIKEKVCKVLESLDRETKNSLEESLTSKIFMDNWLWVYVAYIYYVDIKNESPSKTYDTLLKLKTSENNYLGRIHLTQAFAEHLTYDNIDIKLNRLESIITLRCLCHCDDIDVQIAVVYSELVKLRDEIIEFNFNVNFANWEQTQTIIEIIRLCNSIVERNKVEKLSRAHWDFIVISLGTWSSRFTDIKCNYQDIQIASFMTAIVKLFSTVAGYIKKLYIEQPNNNYVDEWKNVFVDSITTDIIGAWLYIAENYKTKSMVNIPFLQEFGTVIKDIDCVQIFKKRTESMPKWSKLLKRCCELLLSSEHTLQLWGYHMLLTMSPGLIEVDSISVGTNTPHEKGLIFEQFKDLLVQTHNIVQTMLLDFNYLSQIGTKFQMHLGLLGPHQCNIFIPFVRDGLSTSFRNKEMHLQNRLGEDSCRVEPFTDSYTYTFAYLLIWDVLLGLCEKSSTELKYQYADWLKKEDLLNSLLSSIFMLMPSEILHYFDAKVKPLYDWFIKRPSLSLEEPITCEKIERVVCWVYSSTLAQLPASVRQWWSSVESRTSQIVDRVTSAYVSPHLYMQELNDVSDHKTKFKNMTVKIHPSVRELVAIYTVDDAQMELVITLPNNYPLGGPNIQCDRQIDGTSHRQWIKQLRMCVMHQNGRIWDALSLWNNNLDKKFDGVEECYICFAVIHTGTYQLPKLSCKTCRKKFHAACLYKWFSTSNKSTCPICRNLF